MEAVMSIQPMPWPELAPEVAAAIRAICRGKRQVPLPVRVRDELGEVFADEAFAGAFGKEDRPKLITRTASSDHGAAAGGQPHRLDLLLAAGGKQCTASTHVVFAVRDVNRVESARECVRGALEALAMAAPGWVQRVLEALGWAERYRLRADSWRRLTSKTKQEELARVYEADGYALIEAVCAPFSPAWRRHLPAVDVPRIVFQNYARVADRRGRQVIERRQDLNQGGEGLPSGRCWLSLPHDLNARWAAKGSESMWNSYKVHISETCRRSAAPQGIVSDTGGIDHGTRPPNLIINMATTDATVPDTAMTESIYQHLARRGGVDQHPTASPSITPTPQGIRR
ncbi:hypothetical protein ACIBK9_28815 [Nonomuraea sp. NPDC050227]|uniref:hypothetical protein n=1 Tax=Nonomuraea sp. NPDC050227 TaxID=3364360 RepID=UPI00378DE486